MGLYENVKKACAEKGISIHALEQKLEFPKSSLSKWDKNIPSVAKVTRVAKELGVSIDSLTEGVVFPRRGGNDAKNET